MAAQSSVSQAIRKRLVISTILLNRSILIAMKHPELTTALAKIGAGCRYYGKSHVALRQCGLLMEQGGNECALIQDSYSPCRMEVVAGRPPDETVCPIALARSSDFPTAVRLPREGRQSRAYTSAPISGQEAEPQSETRSSLL